MSKRGEREERLKAHLTKLRTEPAVSIGQLRDAVKDILEELVDEKDKQIDGGTF